MSISSLLYQLRMIADRSRRYSQRHFKLIGAIAFITLPLSTYVESAVGDPSFNTLYIRTLAGMAALPFLFHDKLPQVLQRNIEWMWVGAVTFILPFSFGMILTLNAAFTEADRTPSPIWVYQYLVALFIFIQLIHHGPLSALLWIVATAAVCLITLTVESPNFRALQQVWLYPFPVYLTALIVGSITNRNVHMVQSEQLRAASAIGSNIAHELRTPLASIRMLAHGIGRFLPDLVDAYRRARGAEIPVEPISATQLEHLASGLQSIQAEVIYSNTIIDMLLANTSEKPASRDAFERFRISEAIQEAVLRFPFNNSTERTLLSYSIEQDFSVLAPKPLVVHVFFNLIKNALYFVQKGKGGRLDIVAQHTNGNGLVLFTDTGIGIPAGLQPRIFDRFFSSDPASQGAGIGLSFCKMVMDSIGGDIRCESKEGEFTTFRLTFPANRWPVNSSTYEAPTKCSRTLPPPRS